MFKKITEITNEDLQIITERQLINIKNEPNLKKRIDTISITLNFDSEWGFLLLTQELRDNYKKLDNYEIETILRKLKYAQNIGCIEALLDILENFESMEPKSRYLYKQMALIIEIIGIKKKTWCVPYLEKYIKSGSKLMKMAAIEAIAIIRNLPKDSNFVKYKSNSKKPFYDYDDDDFSEFIMSL